MKTRRGKGRWICWLSIAVLALVAPGILGEEPICDCARAGVLAFSSVRDGNSDIYVIHADGTNLLRVTAQETRELEPCWSPDGSMIAYQSQRPSWVIYAANADGTNELQVTNGLSWSPSWSPDGEAIAYSAGAAIHQVSLVRGAAELLTQGGTCGRPNWSPDGQSIAFHSTRSGNNEIYILRLEEGELKAITNHAARDFLASWSPDGQRLAFASDRDGDLDIYTIGVDGTDLLQLTNNDTDDLLPAWSPDGKWIAFVSERDGNAEIYLMQPDGSCGIRLTVNPGEDMYPSWKPIAEAADEPPASPPSGP